MRTGRRFLGADINMGAIDIATRRLLDVAQSIDGQQEQLLAIEEANSVLLYSGIEIYNVNHYDVFRNPVEAKQILIEALEIQPIPGGASVFDGEKDGKMVKVMPVNRIATRADLSSLISNLDEKTYNKRYQASPTKPVESFLLVCMGHEPDLGAFLKNELKPWVVDVEVVDVLRDKANLEFKRDAEAKIVVKGGKLVIEAFYPMNLLQKLSLMKENVEDWCELVDTIKIDWNFDGAIFEPSELDIPGKNELVKGEYDIPDDAGTIKVKITDLLSESLEQVIQPEEAK